MGFKLENTVSSVNVVILAEDNGFRAYGLIDNNAGKRTAEVGEFLIRASMNDSGHFFLDYDNGQIGYVFYMPYGSIEEDEDLELLWVVPASRFEEYGDALLKVILGCSAPKAALEESINNSELKEEAN